MSLYYELNRNHKTLQVTLKGQWNIVSLEYIEKDIKKIRFKDVKEIVFNAEYLENFDSSVAWFFNNLVNELKKKSITIKIDGFKNNHLLIYKRISELSSKKEHVSNSKLATLSLPIYSLGIWAVQLYSNIYIGISSLGEFIVGIILRILQIKKIRLRAIVFHINEVGFKAAPIIALMAFAIAFVTGYQGAFQLEKFDATIYTVDLISLSTLREMGVLITAIMLAGRSGSAFAAQIGTMKLNEEVDALKTMGVSPFDVIVMPRIIAIMISLPLLTVIADIMGLFGGYIFSSSYLGYSYVQFLSRLQEAVDLQQFYIGLYKAPVFALLIGIIGCMQGLRAEVSAEDVGRKTITAVVQSIFLVVVADAIFSIIFTKMGI